MKNVYRVGPLLLALATTLLIGCNSEGGVGTIPDWREAPKTYTCSIEQRSVVERETLFCTTNTGYSSIYCYSTAIMRNCDKIEDAKNGHDETDNDEPRGGGLRMGVSEPRSGGLRMDATAENGKPVLNAAG